MFTNSIRWRLQIWLAFLLICLLSGFTAAVYQLQRIRQFTQIDDDLTRRVALLSDAVRRPPGFGFGPGRMRFDTNHEPPGFRDRDRVHGPPKAPPDFMDGPPRDGERGGNPHAREIQLGPSVTGLFDGNQTNGFYFSVWSREGDRMKSSTNMPAAVSAPERSRHDALTHLRTRESFREAYHYTEMGECVLVGRSITEDLQALREFTLWLLAAGGGVLALGLGGGWLLTSRAIRPVEQISAAASRISAGNLSERIKAGDAGNEIGRLAQVLNSTFARLESAFAQQRQFTADASHELRTPLAVLISETQTALSRARTSEEYKETVEACLETAQQMRRLTESLLDLARLDAGQIAPPDSSMDLAECARACVEQIRPLAAQRRISIHCELAAAPTTANAERISQVITNLLTNAIHYNKDGGDVRVRARVEHNEALIEVEDTGPGIEAADLPHIFERFYRADKSRSRADGRTGLGLAICKAIVDFYQGKIGVESESGKGTKVLVRLRKTDGRAGE